MNKMKCYFDTETSYKLIEECKDKKNTIHLLQPNTASKDEHK